MELQSLNLNHIKFNMLLCLFIFVLLLNSFFAKKAYSQYNEQKGSVNMQGSIFEEACGIDVDSEHQIIDLSVVSFPDFNEVPMDFNVNLVNCEVQDSENLADGETYPRLRKGKFNIIFEAASLTPNLVKLQGGASGFGIEIQDEQGETILLGKPVSIKKSNSKKFKFKLKFVSYPSEPLRIGNFSASIRYRLDYI